MKKYFAVVASLNIDTRDLPEWYVIFPEGWNELEGEGKYLVDAKAWDLVRAMISRRGLEVVFDYEHQSIKGVKAPAAGWIKEWKYTPGTGIEAKIDWTGEAAAYLAKGEYRYYSPVFYVRKGDQRLAGVQSVALTNTPKTNNLKPLLAKLGEQQETEDNNMLEKLIEILGLAQEATEEQVIEAVKKLLADAEAGAAAVPDEVAAALGLEGDANTSVVVASIHALKQAPKGMVTREEHEALKLQIAKRDADEAVAAAYKAGKLTPDQREWATNYAKADLAGFAAFIAKAPVVIPVGELPKKTSQDQGQGGLDAVTLEVAKLMDVSEEDLKKYGGLQ